MNQIEDAPTEQGGGMQVIPSRGELSPTAVRSMEQVRSQMVIAKQFPRDELDRENRVLQACTRYSLARVAIYTYVRGDTVTGPSIRLAEAIAQRWGNLDYGWNVVEEREGMSVIEAYCHDLENNNRASRRWTVKHERSTRRGTIRLTDSRDVYERIANDASRRLRACILQTLPHELVQAALGRCALTIKDGQKNLPLGDRITECVREFSKLGVSREMIEKRLSHPVGLTTEEQLVELIGIWNSIHDKQQKREDFFVLPEAEKPRAAAADLLEAE